MPQERRDLKFGAPGSFYVDLVAKRFNKRTTSSLLKPTTARVALSVDEIFAAANEVAKRLPASPPKKKWGQQFAGDYGYWLEDGRTEHERVVLCMRALLADVNSHGDPKRAPWIIGIDVDAVDLGQRVTVFCVNALTKNGAVEEKDLYRAYQEGLFGLLSERTHLSASRMTLSNPLRRD